MRKILKAVLAGVISASVVLTLPSAVYADADQTEQQKQKSYETAAETNEVKGWPQGPKVYAKSAIIMDMDSGAVLYGKKTEEKHYPASITKLLTALVAVENADDNDKVEFSQDSVSFLKYDDAHIGMRPGEIISMKDALHGLLLASANEVAYAIAENVGEKTGGGYSAFIQKMNERSEELGCRNSHWTNANGLHDQDHYTTAYDMALIASEVSKHQELLDIMQTMSYTIGKTNLVGETRTFQQHHKMLWKGNSNYYKYCIGGKTGYTDDAGTTLVTLADNGKLRLAAVVLFDYGTDAYLDTKAMFDYAYDNFSKVSLSEQKKPEEIREYTDSGAYVVLPSGTGYEDLDTEYTILDEKKASGTVTFLYHGQNVGKTEVTFTPEYVESVTGYSTKMQVSEKEEKEQRQDGVDVLQTAKTAILIAVCTAACAVLILLIVCCSMRRKRKKNPRRRQRRIQKKYRKKLHPRQRRAGTGRSKHVRKDKSFDKK